MIDKYAIFVSIFSASLNEEAFYLKDMLKIRLQRIGKKNSPIFRVVVTERTTGPKGHPVEILGSYNPRSKQISLHGERISHWLQRGAQASPTVHNILVGQKVITGEKISVHKLKPKEAVAASVEVPAAAPAEQKAEQPAPAASSAQETAGDSPNESVPSET